MWQSTLIRTSGAVLWRSTRQQLEEERITMAKKGGGGGFGKVLLGIVLGVLGVVSGHSGQ